MDLDPARIDSQAAPEKERRRPMPCLRDLTGQRFGPLTVLGRAPSDKRGNTVTASSRAPKRRRKRGPIQKWIVRVVNSLFCSYSDWRIEVRLSEGSEGQEVGRSQHLDHPFRAAGGSALNPLHSLTYQVFMLRPRAARAAILSTTSVDVREKRSLADHLLTRMVWAVCDSDWVATAQCAIGPA